MDLMRMSVQEDLADLLGREEEIHDLHPEAHHHHFAVRLLAWVLLFHQAAGDDLLFQDHLSLARSTVLEDSLRSAVEASHVRSSCLVAEERHTPGRSHRRIVRFHTRSRLGIDRIVVVAGVDMRLPSEQVSAQPVQHRDVAALEIPRCMPFS
jgi:hypothetical protein